ncbi:hypothetical protein BFP97_11490 [Roseivirga sp. 4D4]|uniref:hypothetical protein n=1 Tax=Roseivirga sp. 4D4 TaxID=1889784 RepID=UPI000852D4B3|nr:hypothetical protein [Roseivirga sp. 4D4]OEK02106.1 hypothetical protein BFP97_11490 [Roseivirga sp. 4D4]
MDYYAKKPLLFLSLLVLAALMTNCSAAKNLNTYSVNTEGVLEAQIERMNKDAIRLKGQIMTKAQKIADRYQYEFKVTEVVKLGSTFSTAEPKVGETVLLYTPGVVFKKNSEVMMDAFSTPRGSDEPLTLNMIVE